jgi:hypothetical protein
MLLQLSIWLSKYYWVPYIQFNLTSNTTINSFFSNHSPRQHLVNSTNVCCTEVHHPHIHSIVFSCQKNQRVIYRLTDALNTHNIDLWWFFSEFIFSDEAVDGKQQQKAALIVLKRNERLPTSVLLGKCVDW